MLDHLSGVFGSEPLAPPPGPPPAVGLTASLVDEDIMVIAASGLFDEEWYVRQNQDVARSGINPLLHYVRHGSEEGRAPCKDFNAARYMANVEAAHLELGITAKLQRNPLAHFILHGTKDDLLAKGLLSKFSIPAIKAAIARLQALPIFKTADYIAMNEDVKPTGSLADVEPANHALVYGFPEGRRVFMKTTVARVMGAAAQAPFAAIPDQPARQAPDQPARQAPGLPPIGVFYNASGNAFLREIAEDIAATLRSAGQNVRLLDDTSSIEDRPPVCLFVAPHEFFHIGQGPAWAREDVLQDAFLFTTEQPQTLWFERAMPFVLMSRAVIDISWQVHEVFRQSGMPAAHFNPNISARTRWLKPEDARHPLLRVLPKPAQALDVQMTVFEDRLLDVCFFGTESEHREKFFTKNAKFFAGYEAFLYYRKVESPLVAEGTHAALSRLAGHVHAHSKIALNIHRDANGFFEWHRIAKLGIVAGAVVVSEPCDPHPVFKPGVHYLEESGRHILNLVEWLLHTEEGRAQAREIQRNGQAVVRDEAAAARHGEALVAFIQAHRGARA